jgi:hypothetical protein
MANSDNEDQRVLTVLKEGEHRIYRSLDQGVMIGGVPFWWAMGMIFGGFLGFFALKGSFGLWGGLSWIFFLGLAWGIISFIWSQDKTFVPMFILKYIMRAKFYPHITSYTRSRQRVVITND